MITITHFVVFPVMYTTIAHEIQVELMPLAEEADVLGDYRVQLVVLFQPAAILMGHSPLAL